MKNIIAAVLSLGLLSNGAAEALAADNNILFRYSLKYKPSAGSMVSTTFAVPDLYVGEAFSKTAKIDGGNSPINWASNGSLPDGMTFDESGLLSGTPTEAGAYENISFEATDRTGQKATVNVGTISVYDQLTGGNISRYLPIGIPATISVPYAGGKPGFSLALKNGNLPHGLTISNNGISGTPTTEGDFNSVITVTDANGRTADIAIDIVTSHSLIASSTFGDAYLYEAYSGQFSASGGVTPYIWTATGLPANLSLDGDTGQVTGTLETAGSYQITGRVTDGTSFASTSATINAYHLPSLTTKTYPDPYIGTVYSATEGARPSVNGGKSPFTWSATGLPGGMTINASTGVISATAIMPVTPDVGIPFSITARDANLRATTQTYNFTPRSPINIAEKTYPDPYLGAAYPASDGAPPVVTGGRPSYSWAALNLPAGLSINASTGIISGVLTSAANVTATITVADVNGKSASRTFAFTPKAALVLGSKTYPDPYIGTPYSAANGAAPSVTGGKPPYAWSASGLPTGLSINSSTGVISGSVSSTNATTATITVTDANGKSVSENYPFTPQGTLVLAAKTYADPYLQVAYTATEGAAPAVSGGKGPYTWSATGLPAGMSMNPSGLLSGTATSTTAATATVTVKDANGTSASRTYTFTPRVMPALATKTYADPYVNVAYSATNGAAPTASGGRTPYAWAAESLPAGLSINASTGLISGTPSSATAVTATIRITDANGKTASQTYAFTPRAVLEIGTKTYPDPYVGMAYLATEGAAPTVSGGKPSYSWSATGLPTDMSINASTGVISGTTTSTTATTATITVRDANNQSASRTFAFTPRAALAVNTTLPTTMDRTTAVSTTMTATGGKPTYVWSATGLPTGLAINASSGAVTGTPTANGTFSAVVKATDANGKSATRTTSITVTSGSYTVALAGGSSPVTLRSLFTAAQWSSDIPKIVNLASGQIRGNTASAAAVSIGGAWGGSLTFNVAGQIQGAPGAANSGAGGMAFNADVLGATSQKITLNVTGYIRGGGGGGGKGGTGGKGGNGSVSTKTRSPASGYAYSANDSWQQPVNSGYPPVNRVVKWAGVQILSDTETATSYTVGNTTYYRGANQKANITFPSPAGPKITGILYDIYREDTTTTVTTGGAGGAGGNGSAGVGYNAATAANGAAGTAGAVGSGTGAGRGGTGGTGGKGATWGAAGATGLAGATGAAGTTAAGGSNAGAAGAGGVAGGAAGVAINGITRVTLTGTTANVVGTRQ